MLFQTLIFLVQMRKNYLVIIEQYRKSPQNKTPIIASCLYELLFSNSCSLQWTLQRSPQVPLGDPGARSPAAWQEGFTFSSGELLKKKQKQKLLPSWGWGQQGSHPTPTSSKKFVTSTVPNGMFLNVFFYLITLSNIFIPTPRKTEEFRVTVLLFTNFWIFKVLFCQFF